MKISAAPVSYQTHVRPTQVRDMIRHCEALQQAFDRLSGSPSPRRFLDPSATGDAQVVAVQWTAQSEVAAFREAALNNHFVCANWKTFDQLQGKGHDSLEGVLKHLPSAVMGANFLWLRRFIHSVVVREVRFPQPNAPTLQVAERSGWSLVGQALQNHLDQTGRDDPWAEFRQ